MSGAYQSTSAAASSGRLHALDGLRGFLALNIVLFHAYIERPIGLGAFAFLRHGHFMVQTFFVLSGFCLTLSALRRQEGLTLRSYGAYVARRAARLLTPYYAGLLFSLLFTYTLVGTVTGTNWDRSLNISTVSVVEAFVLIQNFTPHLYTINHTYWFIPLLWQFQLVFPLLLTILRRYGHTVLAIFSVMAGFAIFEIGTGYQSIVPLFHLLAIFGFGMAAAHAAVSERYGRVLASPLLIWGVVAFVSAYWWTIYPWRLIGQPPQFIGDALWGAAVAIGMAGLHRRPSHPVDKRSASLRCGTSE
jgi:peptidoglycan/LPS O-acetylase OafA/YrhL